MSLGSARKLSSARRHVSQTAKEARPWIEALSRLGIAAKGVVYVLIGYLAFRAATGPGGKTADPSGALATLPNQPMGKAVLAGLAVGLFGYAVWKLVRAALDPGDHEQDGKRVFKRIGYGIAGAAHLGLALTALRLMNGSGGGGKSARDWTAQLMEHSLGHWAVGVVGLVFLGMGLAALYLAWSAKFQKQLHRELMRGAEEKWAMRAGRVGYAARGVVFSIMGWFVIQAALHHNPRKAQGLGEALNTLARQDHGPWLLGAVAAGLFAYGAYQIMAARCRKLWG